MQWDSEEIEMIYINSEHPTLNNELIVKAIDTQVNTVKIEGPIVKPKVDIILRRINFTIDQYPEIMSVLAKIGSKHEEPILDQ